MVLLNRTLQCIAKQGYSNKIILLNVLHEKKKPTYTINVDLDYCL